ncbi:cyclophilin-like fold protein [Micromonospora cathayae]|uniref:Cyclophilin-like fold protein n=1 Tax=Micromonospora cathayae TaxID=3028804 RepID=A0ABY7ZIL3_9ACTN|nr:cyclophilin-like fold protein [Micromonospora sp. HUAS 3]WDZ82697.1 cyclophilin-like fold protein [Micromonospora sp. HUAS 3]
MTKPFSVVGPLLSVLALAACTTPGGGGASASSPPSDAARSGPAGGADRTTGTVVRFATSTASVDVTIGADNPAVRDFLGMLPLTVEVEEFAGKEKIVRLPRELRHEGAPGSDPEDGDLIYFVPWGNLGFYYDASGIGYSDQTIHLGTYQATRAELARLEGQRVTVAVVD